MSSVNFLPLKKNRHFNFIFIMKRKIYFLLLAAFSIATTISAQFTQDDISFWVGEGENSTILAIDFIVDGEESSFAWGYHFDGTTTGADLLSAIAEADNQLNIDAGSFLNDIFYQDFEGTAGNPYYWTSWSKDNDDATWISNFGIDTEVNDGNWFGCSYTAYDDEFNPINEPGLPLAAIEVIIPFTQDDIIFWIGEGENSSILNVDFIVDGEQSSFAWGVYYDGILTGGDILALVAETDQQFTVNAGAFLNDIFYFDMEGVAGNPYYWTTWTKENDDSEWATNSGLDTEVTNGQWFGCSYTDYNDDFTPVFEPGYPQAVENNNYVAGPYAPGADELGTSAIASDDVMFSSWAVSCVVERGSRDVSDGTATDVNFGIDEDAIGSADGLSVVSLGDGGNAILTFDPPISNGEGPDFAIFENGFGDNFLELAFVEVSSDGINFIRFPSISLTESEDQVGGFGELDPTFIYNFAGKYRANFGTPFDLDELSGETGIDLSNITHIKIIDVIGSVNETYASYDSEGNIINDPFPTAFDSGGFDLDAVGVINSTVSILENNIHTISLYPNPARDFVSFQSNINGKLLIIDQTGKTCLEKEILDNQSQINVTKLASGIYIIKFIGEYQTTISKMVIEK